MLCVSTLNIRAIQKIERGKNRKGTSRLCRKPIISHKFQREPEIVLLIKMISSKSPWKVAQVAFAAGKEAFSDYSHPCSPKKFTQPQLFACLVLKEFEKKDYRGIEQLLADCSDLRQVIGLKCVPHFTTLQKASRRLLKLSFVRRLLSDTVGRILKRRRRIPYAAGDSSGFDAHHASRFYVHRRDADKSDENRPKKRVTYQRYGKLMLIIDCQNHAILGMVASQGPTPDIDQLDSVLAELPARCADQAHGARCQL